MAVKGSLQERKTAESINADVKKRNGKITVVESHNIRNRGLIDEALRYGIPEEDINQYNADKRMYSDGRTKKPYSQIKGKTGPLNTKLDDLITERARRGAGFGILDDTRGRAVARPVNAKVDPMDSIKALIKKGNVKGKHVDHSMPIKGSSNGVRVVSGLDVPDNLNAMDGTRNVSKGNRLPDDFLDFEWKHNPKTGRLNGYRNVDGRQVRVPRAQGGHLNPSAFNHPITRNIGKVGLLGAGEMALNHFWPDNPVAASREKGYDTMQSLGLDLDGAIQGIESTPLQVAARLGQGLLVDPLVTAFGAGNWVGDKINNMFSKD